MTALPATRQQALEQVEYVAQHFTHDEGTNVVTGWVGPEEWQWIIATLRRGAETVGATERWTEDIEMMLWNTREEAASQSNEGKPPRRCLILPESE